jgi:hypothetical protein
VAIGQKTVVHTAQVEPGFCFVEHDEIIARALHFGETDLHGENYHWRRGSFARAKDLSIL